MRFLIGLFVFWSSILGLMLTIKNKTKIKNEFLLALTFTLVGIIMFIAGILNIMKLTVFILILFGNGVLLYNFVNCIKAKKLKKTIVSCFIKLKEEGQLISLIFQIIIFIYITIMAFHVHLTHYDNFSHWAIIVKNIFNNNSLPNFQSTVISFKGYQPGSACFIYYFGLLTGKLDASMIVAQNYLTFSYLTVLFNLIRKNKTVSNVILLLVYSVFVYSTLVQFNELLVDAQLSVIMLSTIILIDNYKDNLKNAVFYGLPFLVFMLLVKNTGLVFALFCCAYIFFLAIFKKQYKEGFKYAIIIGLVLLFFFVIWQQHVVLVFGKTALNSKHALSSGNIIANVQNTGLSNIKLFIKLYLQKSFSLNTRPTQCIFFINLLIIPFLFFKKARKTTTEILGKINLLYICYFAVLALMYILSMPWNEAKVVASYDRYMYTIIITIFGIVIYYIITNLKNTKNIYIIITLLLSAFMAFHIYSHKDSAKVLFGIEDYKDSLVEKYNEVLEYIPMNKSNYYVYSPKSTDPSYMKYISYYYLNTTSVSILTDIQQVDNINYGTLILLENNNVKEQLSSKGWENINKYVYIKE